MAEIFYKGLTVYSGATGDAGQALTDNFQTLADRVGPSDYTSGVDPTVNDDLSAGYYVGSRWINQTTNEEWVCTDNTNGAAVWNSTTSAGSGDVAGPASATDNAIARFNLTTGKLIQDSVIIIDDTTGNMTGPAAGFKITGGTGTTADLTLQTTSGIGASGADMHFLLGNNGATEALTILNSGFLGIGVVAPDAKLHVLGTTEQLRLAYDSTNYYTATSGSTGIITFDAVGSGSSFVFSDVTTITNTANNKLTLTGGSSQNGLFFDAAGGGHPYYLYSSSAGFSIFDNSSTETRLTLDDSGNLALGSMTPFNYANIKVYTVQAGSSGGGVIIADSSGNRCLDILYDSASGVSRFGSATANRTALIVNNSEKVSILNSGNCGINVVAPDAKLHVISTTEQFRVGYDSSNYMSTTASSAGAITFNAVGSGASFTFSDPIKLGTTAVSTNTNELVQSTSNFSTNGDAQRMSNVVKVQTTNNSLTDMPVLALTNDTTWKFKIELVARRTDVDGESAGWDINGVIDRDTNAASTALAGTVSYDQYGDSVSWTVAVVADTSSGALKIQVTGETSKTINWVAHVNVVQVIG